MLPTLVLSLLAVPAMATIYTTNPVASTKAKGGEVLNVQWEDDGSAPSLETIGVVSVDLCIGSNQKQICVQNLGEKVDVSKASSVSATIPADAGENYNNYFIKYTASNHSESGMPYMQFSARFELTGMTGKWTDEEKTYVSNSTSSASGSASGSASASKSAAASSAASSAKPSSSAAASSSDAAFGKPSTASSSAAAASASAPAAGTSSARGLIAPAGLAVAAAIAGFFAL